MLPLDLIGKSRRRSHRYAHGSAGIFLALLCAPSAHAKLGETLPQLVKRFGNTYTETGSEKEGDLRYKFRSQNYSVDAMMSRRGDQLVSNVEVYYSDKPLQANGEPPTATVRGVMNVTAPGAKWHEIAPVGSQKEAFKTADGVYLAAILPPDKSVDPSATFTIAVGKIMAGGKIELPGQPSIISAGQTGEQTAAPASSEPVPPREEEDPKYPASEALAVTLPTGKVVHFQTLEEKLNYEAALGASTIPTQDQPTSTAPATQPVRVVRHFTRKGMEMLQFSDGNVAIRAQLEAKAYDNNEIAADQSFKGQRQPIFGVINSFGVDILGYPYIVLDRSENGFTGVQCTFGKEDAPALASLQKGEIVAVAGRHNGKLFNVQLSECALIPWAKFDYDAPEVQRATSVPKHSH